MMKKGENSTFNKQIPLEIESRAVIYFKLEIGQTPGKKSKNGDLYETRKRNNKAMHQNKASNHSFKTKHQSIQEI